MVHEKEINARVKALQAFQEKISSLTFFDPAFMRKSGVAWNTASDGELVA